MNLLQNTFFAKTSIHAKINIPGSKSITNRALLLAALAEGTSEINDILLSTDTLVFIQALKSLGISIDLNKVARSCVIVGANGRFPQKNATIWCEDSGTAARFLIAACAGSPGIYHFDGSAQLRARPLLPLVRALISQGVRISPDHAAQLPLTVAGIEGLEGGEVTLEGDQSSQFISALLMIAPFAKSTMDIEMLHLVSSPYVEMTCQLMTDFGVLVKRFHSERFAVPAPQYYHARQYTVEPDLSTASYFFAAAAVTAGSVTIQAMDIEKTQQADVKFLNVLEKMGCHIRVDHQGLTVEGPQVLRGVQVNMHDFSDTFMTLAAIAPFATTPTTITNIQHARFKESNRITVMRQELEKCHVKVEEGKDWLKIYPSSPQGALIDSHHDHRIAMAFAVFGLKVPEVQIQHADCVAKTCPEFFALWQTLFR